MKPLSLGQSLGKTNRNERRVGRSRQLGRGLNLTLGAMVAIASLLGVDSPRGLNPLSGQSGELAQALEAHIVPLHPGNLRPGDLHPRDRTGLLRLEPGSLVAARTGGGLGGEARGDRALARFRDDQGGQDERVKAERVKAEPVKAQLVTTEIAQAEAVKDNEPRAVADPAGAMMQDESDWRGEYEAYFDRTLPARVSKTPGAIAAKLKEMNQRTGSRSALIHLRSQDDRLEILLLTERGDVVATEILGVGREQLREVLDQFRSAITDPLQRNKTTYREPAKKLYNWFIRPIEARLQAEKIDLLIFCTGPSLRSAPLAALYDGQKFLIERYAIARIPGFSLMDPDYVSVKGAKVLALGTADFGTSRLVPLPAVPLELQTIVGKPGMMGLWPGQALTDRDFTIDNLQRARAQGRYGIVHLATHAEFRPGKPNDSYIQFWQQRLTLDRLSHLDWQNPPVSLLVLSACRTAIGDAQAELGFAGLAIDAGVKAAVASLWYVSDRGTLALMSEFYRSLAIAPTKSEALRQAQLALLQGRTTIEGDQLRSAASRGGPLLLPAVLQTDQPENLTHPYYWAAFSVIGNPW